MKVSVIIPTYNSRQNDLKKTLSSVYAQSYSEFEVIVVDDGSKIPFAEISNEYEKVKWVQLKVNKGVAAARNEGAKKAKGSFLAFLDVGDWWEDKKLERQMEVFAENPKLGIVYTAVVFHRKNRSRTDHAIMPNNIYRELLIRQCVKGSASSVVIPKEVFWDVGGFFEDFDIPEDRDLWLRIARKYQLKAIDEPLVHKNIVPGSRSADPKKKMITYRRFLERFKEEMVKEGVWDKANSHYFLMIAKKYFRTRKLLIGLWYSCKALLSSPEFVFNGIKKSIRRV